LGEYRNFRTGFQFASPGSPDGDGEGVATGSVIIGAGGNGSADDSGEADGCAARADRSLPCGVRLNSNLDAPTGLRAVVENARSRKSNLGRATGDGMAVAGGIAVDAGVGATVAEEAGVGEA
jgi:hypothetical protein